jgi:integrase/recombinase XerD
VGERSLRIVATTNVEEPATVSDPEESQGRWLEEYFASMRSRGFSSSTVDAALDVLPRMLELLPCFVWELTADVVDGLLVELTERGVGPSTRRRYIDAVLGFHRFLRVRKRVEVEASFGSRLEDPVDEFNACHHVGSDSPAVRPPPRPDELEEFFERLRTRVGTARKYAAAARDYALFRTLYLAGLRAEESVMLDVADVHFDRGPFGKLHVRFGKGARTSGPRARWVPMLDRLDVILRWFIADVRPGFGDGPALFCEEGGDRLSSKTLRNRLVTLWKQEGAGIAYFSPHDLRRACATRNYERGVDLVAIQQMLGHWQIGTTMRYVIPSATFIEDSYRRAVSTTLCDLNDGGEVR